jgi:hypothetical protein
MKNKPQKRFTAVFEIDAEILRLKKQAKHKLERQEELKRKSDELLRKSETSETAGEQEYFVSEAHFQLKKSERMGMNYNYIINKKIPALVKTRAALLTVPMPFVDQSVSEEKV